MNLLGIDTSSTDLGIGLYRDGEPVASYSRYLANSHAEHIVSCVSLLLSDNGMSPGDLTRCAVTVGPGSFTGLRIGIAFVKGFCTIGGIEVLPVSSLLVLAHGALPAEGPVVAAIDARRDDVFFARFTASGNSLCRETADVLTSGEEFRSVISDCDTVVTDTMGYGRSTVFGFLGGRPGHVAVESHPLQRGLVCSRIGAAAREGWTHAREVLPSYLRAFTPTHGTRAA